MAKRRKLTWRNYCARPEDRIQVVTQVSVKQVAPTKTKWRLSPGLPDGLVRYLREQGKLK